MALRGWSEGHHVDLAPSRTARLDDAVHVGQRPGLGHNAHLEDPAALLPLAYR